MLVRNLEAGIQYFNGRPEIEWDQRRLFFNNCGRVLYLFQVSQKRRYRGKSQKAFSVSDVLPLTCRASLKTEIQKPDLDRAESS